jgi:hypothetical protein
MDLRTTEFIKLKINQLNTPDQPSFRYSVTRLVGEFKFEVQLRLTGWEGEMR